MRWGNTKEGEIGVYDYVYEYGRKTGTNALPTYSYTLSPRTRTRTRNSPPQEPEKRMNK